MCASFAHLGNVAHHYPQVTSHSAVPDALERTNDLHPPVLLHCAVRIEDELNDAPFALQTACRKYYRSVDPAPLQYFSGVRTRKRPSPTSGKGL